MAVIVVVVVLAVFVVSSSLHFCCANYSLENKPLSNQSNDFSLITLHRLSHRRRFKYVYRNFMIKNTHRICLPIFEVCKMYGDETDEQRKLNENEDQTNED